MWDFEFACSNLLLAVLFGAAAGNVGRGVPLDANGDFSMAFFTNFNVRGNVGWLDWYTVSVAFFTVALLAAHGATYLMLKTEGPVHDRSSIYARRLWVAVVPLFVEISVESWFVRPDVPDRAFSNPLWWLGVLVVIASVFTLISRFSTNRNMTAFLGSNVLIVGLLAIGSAAIFPVMLYSIDTTCTNRDNRNLFYLQCSQRFEMDGVSGMSRLRRAGAVPRAEDRHLQSGPDDGTISRRPRFVQCLDGAVFVS
jgi:cytochrome d ubiquinol oxidase subunit II